MLAPQLSLTFAGPTLVLCRFLCYQSRVSELLQAQLSCFCGFFHYGLDSFAHIIAPPWRQGWNRRKGGRGNEDSYVKWGNIALEKNLNRTKGKEGKLFSLGSLCFSLCYHVHPSLNESDPIIWSCVIYCVPGKTLEWISLSLLILSWQLSVLFF